ncbi:hypothetical protein [Microlunatus phosphovorus]|uniref:hypothetical protein n=1 Tax=Microlunatus phosphovorus TaxID=29405 RepID=UPI0012EA5CCA|nr:hypothetical protein [Microlunatus phosphovorus]
MVEPGVKLPADRVGRERAKAPVRVFAELGLLPDRAGSAAGDDPHVGWPAVQPVPVQTVAQDRGEAGDLRVGLGFPVGTQPAGPCCRWTWSMPVWVRSSIGQPTE